MINLEKKIIFIANPKSGSDTLRKYLRKYGFKSEKWFLNEEKFVELCREKIPSQAILKDTIEHSQREHVSCFLYKEYLHKYTNHNWDDFFVFSTIRNPWSRYVSAFKYVCRHQDYLYKESFSNYAKNPTFKHVRPFSFMFKDNNNRLLCHNFIEMTQINKEVPKLLKKFNFSNVKIPSFENISSYSAPYFSLYDEETEDMIRKRCQEVITRFKYKFGE